MDISATQGLRVGLHLGFLKVERGKYLAEDSDMLLNLVELVLKEMKLNLAAG